MKKNLLIPLLAVFGFALAAPASAAQYLIDTKNAHAFIQFKISHLGFSWVLGRFNEFEGTFSYDENDPSAASAQVTINPASVDTNNSERDKHLRSEDFLKVDEFTQATFTSTGYQPAGEDKGILKGDLTLHGVTRPITIDVTHIGAGKDPWGGYRRGFEGTTTLTLADFGIPMDLGPAARSVEIFLTVEGIRQ